MTTHKTKKNSLFNRVLQFTTRALGLYAAFAHMPQSFNAVVAQSTPVRFQGLNDLISYAPLCAPQDKFFYDGLSNYFTVAANDQNSWVTHAKNKNVEKFNHAIKQNRNKKRVQEEHLISLALLYDMDVLEFLKSQNIRPNRHTLRNFLTRWQLEKKSNSLRYGILRQYEMSYDYLQAHMPESQLKHNVELMLQAVKQSNEFVIDKLLHSTYDIHAADKLSGEVPAFIAFSSNQFTIFEMFLKHGYSPEKLGYENVANHFMNALMYRIVYQDVGNNLKFILQLANSNHTQQFFAALAKLPEGQTVLKRLELIKNDEFLARINIMIQIGRMMKDTPLPFLVMFLMVGSICILDENYWKYIIAMLLIHHNSPKPLGKSKKEKHERKAKMIIKKPKDPIKEMIIQGKQAKAAAKKSIYNRLSKLALNYYHALSGNVIKIQSTKLTVIETEESGASQVNVLVSAKSKLIINKPHKKHHAESILRKPSTVKRTSFYPVKEINIDELKDFNDHCRAKASHGYAVVNRKTEVVEEQEIPAPVLSVQTSVEPSVNATVTRESPNKTKFCSMFLAKNELPYEAYIVMQAMNSENTRTLIVGGILRDLITRILFGIEEDPTHLSDLDFVAKSFPDSVRSVLTDARSRMSGALIQTKIHNRRIDIFKSEAFKNHSDIDDALHMDAQMRPFTIDKLYAKFVNGGWLVIDPTGRAIKDVIERRIITDNDPDEVLKADPLIILRAYYYSIEKYYHIDASLEAAIERQKNLVINLTIERLNAFMHKLAQAKHANEIWFQFDKLGISRYIWNIVKSRPVLVDLVRPMQAYVNRIKEDKLAKENVYQGLGFFERHLPAMTFANPLNFSFGFK